MVTNTDTFFDPSMIAILGVQCVLMFAGCVALLLSISQIDRQAKRP